MATPLQTSPVTVTPVTVTPCVQCQFWQFINSGSYTENDVVTVTLAYSDTFLLSRGCHCKRVRLYTNPSNIGETAAAPKRGKDNSGRRSGGWWWLSRSAYSILAGITLGCHFSSKKSLNSTKWLDRMPYKKREIKRFATLHKRHSKGKLFWHSKVFGLTRL